MSGSTDMAQRHGRVLTELAELGLELARDLKGRAQGASTLKEAEGFALAFHRISRSVRLTLALESKLARERLDIVKAERSRAQIDAMARQHQISTVLTRQIRTETEGEAAESLLERLDERLEEDQLFARFLDGPVEAAIARIREDLGLAANDAGPAGVAPSQATWRSSA